MGLGKQADMCDKWLEERQQVTSLVSAGPSTAIAVSRLFGKQGAAIDIEICAGDEHVFV